MLGLLPPIGMRRGAIWAARKYPGVVWAADFEKGQYYHSGRAQPLGNMVSDVRSTDIVLPDAHGVLQTIAAGQPARTSKGLGLFGGAENLVTTSEDFSSFSAGNLNRTTGHAAPDQTNSATRYEVVAPGVASICAKNGHIFSSNMAAVSWHIKRYNRDVVTAHGFGLYDTSAATNRGFIRFNFATGETSIASGIVTTHGAKKLANDLWRIWMILPVVAGNSNNLYLGAIGNSSMLPGEGWHVWGVQAEIDNVTPYIKTNGTAVTRTACEPVAVQGAGPTPFPGYDPSCPELTFAIEWEDVPTEVGTAKQLLFFQNHADYGGSRANRASLYLSGPSSSLTLAIYDGANSFQGGANAGNSMNDGARHLAVGLIDRSSKTLSLAVDGTDPVTFTASSFADHFGIAVLGHDFVSTPLNPMNGFIPALAFANGNFFDAWR